MVETGQKEVQPKYEANDYWNANLYKSEITCATKGKTKKSTKVNKLENHLFRTNIRGKYGANVKCSATYEMTGDCTKMTVSCDKFSLKGNDFLYVKRSGKRGRKYKGRRGPNLSSTGKHMKLYFRSNSANEGPGASCTVQCRKYKKTRNWRRFPFNVKPNDLGCKTNKGVSCVFPFKHKGVTYNECTKRYYNRPWCSTKTDKSNNFISGFWGECDSACSDLDIGIAEDDQIFIQKKDNVTIIAEDY